MAGSKAQANPAIDVLQSISRLMNDIVPDERKKAAGRLRNLVNDGKARMMAAA